MFRDDITKAPINEIEVGERRREDMGDLSGLAESIRVYGLLQPIVVDGPNGSYRLVAGRRRLEACKRLGFEQVPVRCSTDLSEAELREIELEENLRRKDLTEYERSKDMVQLAEVTAEADRAQPISFPEETKTENGKGRPEEPGSVRRVAERIGVSPGTITKAKQHVAAVEKYPELKEAPKTEAIKTAKKLDSLPEPERKVERERIKAAPKTPAEVDHEVKSAPSELGHKACDRLRHARMIIEKAGGPQAIMDDLSQTALGPTEQWLFLQEIQAIHPVITDWLRLLDTHNGIRRIK